jgi:hypothetical protein
VESGVTEFSLRVQLVLLVARDVLSCAQQYRHERYWALPPVEQPVLQEGFARSDDEAGVRAWYAAKMGREWPERQMIHRAPRTPEGTADWDALEAQLAHRRRRAKASETSGDVISLKGKIAACDELLERLSPQSEEWEDVQEAREQLRQRLRGCHP